VAPCRNFDLFSAAGRWDDFGNLTKPPTAGAKPKNALTERAYLFDEGLAITDLRDRLKQFEK
jgi:hypothetical protein